MATGLMKEERLVGRDGFFEIIQEISTIRPDIPVFDIKQVYFKYVCPESLVDPFYSQWAIIEAACERYHWTVEEALEIPEWVLETFNILTAATNSYARVKEKIAQQQVKSASKPIRHRV